MAHFTILREYAEKAEPDTLSPEILLTHTDFSITIFDRFPKAIFHFLVLPRILRPLTPENTKNLRALLRGDKELARRTVERLGDDAKAVRDMIEAEMAKRFGFKWPIWIGFHAIPSMEHLHLHVISSDLCSPSLKTKKHYNTFKPKLGFFIDIDDVLSWFDAESSYFKTMSKLEKPMYEPKLKEPLDCFHCQRTLRNMPLLKEHLDEEWKKIEKREKAKAERLEKLKRKAPAAIEQAAEGGPSPSESQDDAHVGKRGHLEEIDETEK